MCCPYSCFVWRIKSGAVSTHTCTQTLSQDYVPSFACVYTNHTNEQRISNMLQLLVRKPEIKPYSASPLRMSPSGCSKRLCVVGLIRAPGTRSFFFGKVFGDTRSCWSSMFHVLSNEVFTGTCIMRSWLLLGRVLVMVSRKHLSFCFAFFSTNKPPQRTCDTPTDQ